MNSFKEAFKSRGIALIALIIVMAGILGIPAAVRAESFVGTVNGTGYTTLEALISAVGSSTATEITISMSRDWDAAVDAGFNRRLEIPSSKKVTLNMNGHIFNRNLARTTASSGGELIYLKSNSTLIVNGGESSSSHNVLVHSSTDSSSYATTSKTVTGGTLAGGSSTNNGGGIHATSNCNITLNSVTIAGCRTGNSMNDGYGGGIRLYGSDINLTLNNSTITGCFANKDGGGVYSSSDSYFSNTNYVNLDMKNSKVEYNYAGENGGGINFNGTYLYLTGDGNSYLSYNAAKEKGGGIYAGSNQSISGLSMDNNKAVEGGGVYAKGTDVYLSNLKIFENEATRGGGIYAYENKQTIASCLIRDNSGHGVYVGSGVKTSFKITGSSVIKGNTASGAYSNLYLSDSSWSNNRVNFDLSKPAEVYISYNDGDYNTIMVTEEDSGVKARDCTQFLFSDQEGFYFDFFPAPNMRKIMRIRGTRPPLPTPTQVPVEDANDATKPGGSDTRAGIKGTVGPGGEPGSDYNLLRGFFRHVKGDSYEENTDGVFYYSDGLFFENPATYNSHLATLSLSLANSSMYLNGSAEPVEGNSYYEKHLAVRQFLADIGCSDQTIYLNDSYINKPQVDSIGVIMANKALRKSDGTDTGKILLPVVIRSGGYEAEWGSNMTLGPSSEKEHSGFATAADQVFKELMTYIKNQGLEAKYNSGDIKFWFAGFSRGGATANLTAKRLVEKISSEGRADEVFAYCCEAPKGGHDQAETLSDKTKYYCIHNLINTVDLVPYVGPEQMGMKRYGVDHYIPGNAAGTVSSRSVTVRRGDSSNRAMTVTTYSDNNPLATKSGEYDSRRNSMQIHLKAIDPSIVFDDYFTPMTMSFVPIKTYANPTAYDTGNRAEDYVKDLIRFLQEGISPTEYNNDTQAVRNRDRYVSDYQQALRDIVGMLYAMDPVKKDGFTSKASTISDRMSYSFMLDVYMNLIGKWKDQSADSKRSYISSFWNLLKGTGALEYLNAKEKQTLETSFPKLVDMMMRLLDADNTYKPGEHTSICTWAHGNNETMAYIATLVSHSKYILSCHYPEINLAWARSYDSWYDGEDREYEISLTGLNMEAPGAYVMDGSTEKALSQGTNNVTGSKKLILDCKNKVGEAIFYDLYDSKTGTTQKNILYRDQIDLVEDDNPRTYKITAYSISYGIKSVTGTYTIIVTKDDHSEGGGGYDDDDDYYDDDDDYSGSSAIYTPGIIPMAGVSLLPGGRPAAVNGPAPTVSRRGKIGWEAIKDLLLEETDKDVKVEMNGTTVVPTDILESIRGKDITLSLEMGNGFTWIIKGTDIGPGALKDINLGVKKDRGGIPVDVYIAITGENYSIAISLESTGDFGFKAALSLDLERKNAGLYANLFYYNPSGGKAEFISAGLIGEDGTALLEFTHASDYLIVINKEVLDPGRGGKNEKSAQAESDKGEVTSVKARTIPIWFIVIMVVVLLAGAFGVYCIYRRR